MKTRFQHVLTKENFIAIRVEAHMTEDVDGRVGDWLLQRPEGGPVKLISAVQSVIEYEEIPANA